MALLYRAARGVLSATAAFAVMGTLVASVVMLTAWDVATHGKAPDEAAT
jgi:hypothetical protein